MNFFTALGMGVVGCSIVYTIYYICDYLIDFFVKYTNHKALQKRVELLLDENDDLRQQIALHEIQNRDVK